jgi:SNF2 family DNA or RNA helicase
MLDLVEKALNGTGFQFQRIDGSKSSSNRKKALRVFNESPSCTILLATLGSAGVGYVFILKDLDLVLNHCLPTNIL